MSKNIVEAMFNSKKDLSDTYPSYPGVQTFDLEKQHYFYGRIDKNGDAVYLNHSALQQVYGGKLKTHFAVDFVADAFSDLNVNINKVGNAHLVNRNSLYKTKMKAYKAWDHGDLEYEYNLHLNKLYTNFVDSYLPVDNRHSKIKNYKDFVKEFVRYAARTAQHFPVTKTGFITSNKCSPFVSGLMIETAAESHGIENIDKIRRYIQDDNASFFAREVAKFGFMVDKNAPWRLIFNLASGRLSTTAPAAGGKYMARRGASYDNIFETYYNKAYEHELINIKNKFSRLYEQFYSQYSTYPVQTYVKCIKNQDTYDLRVLSEKKEREAPPTFENDDEEFNEYWMKIILKLRMVETNFDHSQKDFNFYAKKVVDRTRLYGTPAALSYINDLTKGFYVTKFNTKGLYWHGKTQMEYEKTLKLAYENALNPSRVNYSLTGTKNTK